MGKIKAFLNSHYKFPFIFLAIIVINSILNIIGVNKNISDILLPFMELFVSFMICFKYGKISNRKAIFEGTIIGFKIVLTFFIFGIFFLKITLSSLILYIMIVISSILGAIYGKNKAMK